MATNRSEVVAFEFSNEASVVGRATWLAPGMVELDFEDPELRRRLEGWFAERQEDLAAIFEPDGDLTTFWRDENPTRFTEACWTLSNYYRVRRVH